MPPFVGLAVKLTEAFAQIVLALALIVMEGVTIDVTVKLKLLLVAVCPLIQLALLVTTHATTSPCTIEFDE